MERKYKISIIMAVYNVEQFVAESIESVIAQDIGFENIQLILVDDGSQDNSLEICRGYAQKYPQNILLIHKENGGVSSARNEGLKHVQGEYVNFLDSDDKLSANAVSVGCGFLDENRDRTDVAAFPMRFFDGAVGEHILNKKFRKGTRVIDLDSEWRNTAQLSMSSAFVRADCVKEAFFDSRLAYAEDAQLMLKILGEKCTLGVVSNITYWYRRRSAGTESAVQGSASRKEWYLPYMQYFQQYCIKYFLNKLGYVPFFVQNTLMYHLQWRFFAPIPAGVLTEEESQEHTALLREVLSHIDDEVIMAQENIFREQRWTIFKLKYQTAPKMVARDNDVAFVFGNRAIFKISNFAVRAEFWEMKKEVCTLRGMFAQLPVETEAITLFAKVNEKFIPCEFTNERNPSCDFTGVNQLYKAFTLRFPVERSTESKISFYCCVNDTMIPLRVLRCGTFFPVGTAIREAYALKNGWFLSVEGTTIKLEPYNKKRHRERERAFVKEVWKKNKDGYRRAVIMRQLVKIINLLKRKPLWVISDRMTKAGDNGEAFFRYLRENHKKVNAVFAIDKSSPDYKKMKKIGPVVNHSSKLYKLLVLASNFRLSSAGEAQVYNPFVGYSEPYRDLLQKVNFIFLQHGVTKDDQSVWLGRYNRNIRGFVTAGVPEYESIVHGKYEYPESYVWLTGFPRFDRLYENSEKWITIMPTWREYLLGAWNSATDSRMLKAGTENSTYVTFYRDLLNHPKLLQAARDFGYHLVFLPHPNFQPHLHIFGQNNQVTFLGKECSYTEVYSKSDLVVTDYSSAVFDFAYMRKPVVYCQFDAEEFFSGNHVYAKGYFSYEEDGFGEVEKNLEDTVNRIIAYMQSGCQLKEKYRERVDRFFAFKDKNNSQRVYDKLLALMEETKE